MRPPDPTVRSRRSMAARAGNDLADVLDDLPGDRPTVTMSREWPFSLEIRLTVEQADALARRLR